MVASSALAAVERRCGDAPRIRQPRPAIADIVQGERLFGSITATHSQPGNIERVARREADATCVDSVTYAFFCRHRPQRGALTRVLAATPPGPSIPFMTSV